MGCIIISLLFFSIFHFAAALNFSFTSFNANDAAEFNSEGDVFFSSGAIQLAEKINGSSVVTSIGRVTYKKPLYLWDKASRNLTDFTTHFTFVIDSQNKTNYGDGITFFLVANGSGIQGGGGAFGLANGDDYINSTANEFVAVEFDIFHNDNWDPIFVDDVVEHVGVDINSVISNASVPWFNGRSSIMNGWTNEACISYASSSKNLSVAFRSSSDGTGNAANQTLDFVVDLREYLPEWVNFGFSAATGSVISLNHINSWVFNSNLEFDEASPVDPVAVPPSHSNPNAEGPSQTNPRTNVPTTSKSNNIKMGLVVGLVVGGFVLVCILAIYLIFKKKKIDEIEDPILIRDDFMDGEFEKGIGPKKFSYNALAKATSNFAPTEKLGEGGFGEVYKGFLTEMNVYVAVKRVSRDSSQGIKEYASEVRIISRLRHKNLVQLIGWCHKQNNLLLVYEYMQNGSLDSHLFKGKSLLSWNARYKIAHGLASVLLYLHEEWEQCVVHRDIKSSNVMLDLNFNTKLGDFGLARFVDHDKGSQTTIVAGTRGYMAPECFVTGQASRESDVFSFGVVALEIACGRKPIDVKLDESRKELVKWVWDLYGTEQILEAADPKLSGDYDEHEMKRLMIVGLWCAHPDRTSRPSIRQVIHVLNDLDASLPALPAKMPVATYFTPSDQSSTSLENSLATTQRSQTPSTRGVTIPR
ncbi:L-type lectin-domain containing receptor kinase IX.1-like [Apium graveolens]|uniref:L-type lectin-domain containing receptor kinase IX.1-like n=1 Tax=Apium graveolens TaxID=4045 RepID=UPI003D7966DE